MPWKYTEFRNRQHFRVAPAKKYELSKVSKTMESEDDKRIRTTTPLQATERHTTAPRPKTTQRLIPRTITASRVATTNPKNNRLGRVGIRSSVTNTTTTANPAKQTKMRKLIQVTIPQRPSTISASSTKRGGITARDSAKMAAGLTSRQTVARGVTTKAVQGSTTKLAREPSAKPGNSLFLLAKPTRALKIVLRQGKRDTKTTTFTWSSG